MDRARLCGSRGRRFDSCLVHHSHSSTTCLGRSFLQVFCMSKAKAFSFYLLFLDFFIGFIFGSIGYFFALLAFPILAIFRGSIVGLFINKTDHIAKLRKNAIAGALAFLLGLLLGIMNLIYFLAPRYELYRQRLTLLDEKNLGLTLGIVAALFIACLFFLIYSAVSYIAGLLIYKAVSR